MRRRPVTEMQGLVVGRSLRCRLGWHRWLRVGLNRHDCVRCGAHGRYTRW